MTSTAQAVIQSPASGRARPAYQERIFKGFARFDGSRTLEAGGSGFGLAITRRITELHGGP